MAVGVSCRPLLALAALSIILLSCSVLLMALILHGELIQTLGFARPRLRVAGLESRGESTQWPSIWNLEERKVARTLLDGERIGLVNSRDICKWKLPKCSLKECFEKCPPGALRVYIYSEEDLKRAQIYPGRVTLDEFAMQMRKTNYTTQVATDACLFLVAPSRESPLQKLDFSRLPFWNGGSNHILVDRRPKKCERLEAIGKALLYKTNIDFGMMRMGFDIPAPLHSGRHRCPNKDEPVKEKLLVFKGSVYVPPKGGWGRAMFGSLHNGKDIVFLSHCNIRDYNLTNGRPQAQFCARERADYDKYDYYSDLAYKSRFCLVPAGRQSASYRLGEVMSIGCIPVVTEDPGKLKVPLPYEGWSGSSPDWDKSVLRFPTLEEALSNMIPTLSGMPHSEYLEMRAATMKVHDALFGLCNSDSGQIHLHHANLMIRTLRKGMIEQGHLRAL